MNPVKQLSPLQPKPNILAVASKTEGKSTDDEMTSSGMWQRYCDICNKPTHYQMQIPITMMKNKMTQPNPIH